MKPETKLKRRVAEVLELCKQLGYPYAFVYSDTFDTNGSPLKANVYGAVSKPEDWVILVNTLNDCAREQMFLGPELIRMSMSSAKKEAIGEIELEDYDACSIRGG